SAVPVCVVADGDDVIERLARELADALWLLAGEVYADLLHGGDRVRIDARRRLRSGGENVQAAVKGFQKIRRHLAACRIAGAEHQDTLLRRSGLSVHRGHCQQQEETVDESNAVAPFLFVICTIIEIYFDDTGKVVACKQNSDERRQNGQPADKSDGVA